MSQLSDLIDSLRAEQSCTVAPPTGQPHVAEVDSRLPDDLREFFEICGGVTLFRGANFEWAISGPSELTPTNLIVLGGQVPDDITATWHVIARQPHDSSALVSIDLSEGRRGWTYDSDVEVHGVAGSCTVISHSFTDLLAGLIACRGEYIFWEDDSFVSLGDAYD